MVTSAGRPSGIAATANPIAAEISSGISKSCSTRPITSMSAAMPRITSESTLPNWVICCVSGVSNDSVSVINVWMRPISVAEPVADPRVTLDRVDTLGRGNRLTSQRRLLDLKVHGFEQPHVGGHAIAGLDAHDVAGHDVVALDVRPATVPADLSVQRQHVSDARQGLLRPALLHEPDQRVDHGHREDDGEVDPLREDRLENGCCQQDVDEDVVEVPEQPPQRARARRVRQPVRAHLGQAPGGIGRRQAVR